MPRDKSRYRDRRNSSISSDSSYEKRKKSKHKRRSRSRDRSESSSYKRRRSSSRTRQRRRSYSRSVSRERYESKSKGSSRSRSKKSRKSVSRGGSRSRSSSISTSKYKKNHKSKSKSRRRSHSSRSRSRSYSLEKDKSKEYETPFANDSEKLEKAIKAAEAAGLTMTKIPNYEFKSMEVKEDMPTIHDRNLLDELNSDSFVPKSFTSSKSKKKNIILNLDTNTVKLPPIEIKEKQQDNVINIEALPCEDELVELWIKKLYQYRKKMLRGDT